MPARQGKAVLSGVRVLETGNAAARFAGWLLGGLGAEVMRLEAPGAAPAVPRYLDAAKRRLDLDLTTSEGCSSFRGLAAGANVIVETFGPDYLSDLGLGYADLAAGNPGLVVVSITPFGRTGPRAADAGSELVVQATGGWLSVTGEAVRPVRLPGLLAHHTAALFAVNGILLALRHRRATGKGQLVDISLQECAAATLDHVLPRYAADGTVAQRQGSLHWNNAFRVFPCADGHVLLSIHREWDVLVGWMAAEGAAADLTEECWRDEVYRNEHIGHVIDVITHWTKKYRATDLVGTGQLMRFPWAKVVAIEELPADPHLAARGLFTRFTENGKTSAAPGAPFRLSASPWRTGGGQ